MVLAVDSNRLGNRGVVSIAIPRDCSAGRVNAAAEAASREVVKRGKEVNNMVNHEARVSCTFFLSDRKRGCIRVV